MPHSRLPKVAAFALAAALLRPCQVPAQPTPSVGASLSMVDGNFLSQFVGDAHSANAVLAMAAPLTRSPAIAGYIAEAAKDYAVMERDAVAIARQQGLTPPATTDPLWQGQMTELQAAGKNFDTVFVTNQRRNLGRDIARSDALIDTPGDPKIRDFASRSRRLLVALRSELNAISPAR